ncbi:class I SAM-dependent methyltransferase [Pseudomonas corrugata]|uniref:site-specific DNA-methyltransferase (adenine-specific) n=1 Tax=Pseudomonas corrugata TaxID=47879 RepID=A0A7Y6DH12_9PSED|nr:class I SAM-dependent methyltransferase [Pseudomonas corrugata]NUT87565.1 class I SAM-dependent methyltransferase [Pseudomonas corrugata]
MNFIENETAQKLRGGYYTPFDLALFLTRWVGEINPKRILEPSCGDGVFLESIAEVPAVRNAEVMGFELEPDEAAKAQTRANAAGSKTTTIINEDFLGWSLKGMWSSHVQFDAVLGNPPFIRYQYLPEPFQANAEKIFKGLNLPFTKHTNAWVPFILASISMLRPGGRLAMVVPAEIIHVTHAQSLRSYLGHQCRRIVIVDPEDLWFEGTLQGAVILMAEKKNHPDEVIDGLGIYPVKGRDFVNFNPADVFRAPKAMNGETVQGKWTRALLDADTRNLFNDIAKHQDVHKFKDIAKVEVGIVTGANKFFLVSDEVVASNRLQKWAYPMFGRSEHCPGIIYNEQQHKENARKGSPTNFIWFKDGCEDLDGYARSYIEQGEAESLHTRYKCRIRSPWFKVPSVHFTEIGMLKRSHNTPRLILNEIGAYTTDTAYRIKSYGISAERLVGCFVNPLTALSAELESRHYGGGVLELIPSEIAKLVIPTPEVVIDLPELDKAIRTRSTHEVLTRQGWVVLGALGVSRADQDRILEGWRMLRDRRQRSSSEPLDELV